MARDWTQRDARDTFFSPSPLLSFLLESLTTPTSKVLSPCEYPFHFKFDPILNTIFEWISLWILLQINEKGNNFLPQCTFSSPPFRIRKFFRKFSIEHSRHAHVDLTKRSTASQPRSHLRRRRRCKLNWYADTWNTILPESHSLRFYKLRRHARTLLITLSTILIERSDPFFRLIDTALN